jgi:hypothetical protein
MWWLERRSPQLNWRPGWFLLLELLSTGQFFCSLVGELRRMFLKPIFSDIYVNVLICIVRLHDEFSASRKFILPSYSGGRLAKKTVVAIISCVVFFCHMPSIAYVIIIFFWSA